MVSVSRFSVSLHLKTEEDLIRKVEQVCTQDNGWKKTMDTEYVYFSKEEVCLTLFGRQIGEDDPEVAFMQKEESNDQN